MKYWLIGLIGIWLLLPGAVLAQGTTVPLAGYWQLVADTHELIGRLDDEPVEVQQAQLAAAADQFDQLTAVSLPDGQIIPLDHTFLQRELEATPPDLDRLEGLFSALLAAQEVWPEGPGVFDQAALAQILAQPEFQYQPQEPNLIQRWWQRLWARILQWLANLAPGTMAGGQLLNVILTVLGIIFVLVILSYILRTFLGSLATEVALSAGDEMGAGALTADMALDRAQTLSSSGDYRTAVRYLYLSSLLLLEERGLLRYNRALTNREYLRSIAHQPELAAVLRDVIEVFDRVWYGYQPLAKPEYEQYALQVETLKQQRRGS